MSETTDLRTARLAATSPAPVSPATIESLITRAREHALGESFLRDGALDAVAATFGVHAFVIDAARDHLRKTRDDRAVEVHTDVAGAMMRNAR